MKGVNDAVPSRRNDDASHQLHQDRRDVSENATSPRTHPVHSISSLHRISNAGKTNDATPRRDAAKPRPPRPTKDAATETENSVEEIGRPSSDAATADGEADSKEPFEKWDTLWADSDDDDNENASKFGAVFSDSSSSSGSDQVTKCRLGRVTTA